MTIAIAPTKEERKRLLEALLKNGLWAVLSIALVAYVLYTNNEREKRYIQVIADQAEGLTELRTLREGQVRLEDSVNEIKYRMRGR